MALLQLDYGVDTDLAGDVKAGSKQRITLAASLVVLTALLWSPLTSASVPRGLFVWFMQLPLYALFAALIAGGVFFWRGLEQVTRDPWAKDQLITGAWIFGGLLGAILLVVFGVSMLRRFGRAR